MEHRNGTMTAGEAAKRGRGWPRLALLAALAAGGCASQGGQDIGSITPPSATASAAPSMIPATAQAGPPPVQTVAGQTVSRLPSPGAYTLNAEELGLGCKKLSGRMAVRIVQVRDFKSREQTTQLARSLQTAAKPMFGGSGEGTDPDGRYARDRAMLEAYNQRLIEKQCPSYDLEAELSPGAKSPPRLRPAKKP